MTKKNILYYGDNLSIMRDKMGLAAVDLIYLDPPFNSKKDYNLLYRQMTGYPVPEQAEAFSDMWTLDAEKDWLARQIPYYLEETGHADLVAFWDVWMKALQKTNKPLLAYLIYMVPRLLEMSKVLSPTGSIYFHCDPNVSHYIKVMMDAIFGHTNFRNEIIWKRTGAHGRARRWGPIHDVILFYSRSKNYTWNRTYEEYDASYIEGFYRLSDEHGRYQLVSLDGPGTRTGSSGMPWRDVDPTYKGRHWELPPDRALPDWFVHPDGYSAMTVQERLDVLEEAGLIYWPSRGVVPRYKRYLSVGEGNPLQDVVTDIGPLSAHSMERLGYQTQKPTALLKRIILASTNEYGTVFDPFCGCGTSVYAAVETNRHWIGCDIAILAINRVEERLRDRYGFTDFVVDGIPTSIASAEALFKKDPFQFEHWIVEKVKGFPNRRTRGDLGIDGRLYFDLPEGLREMVLSVKGGNIRPADIRELRGVLEREPNAVMAGFLSLREPTKAMRDDAELAGMVEIGGMPYRKIQLLSVSQIFDHKTFRTPAAIGARSSRQQPPLPLGWEEQTQELEE